MVLSPTSRRVDLAESPRPDRPETFGRKDRRSLLRLTPINHLGTPPVLDQVLRIHPLGRLKGGPADQQIGRPCQHFIAAVRPDDFEGAQSSAPTNCFRCCLTKKQGKASPSY